MKKAVAALISFLIFFAPSAYSKPDYGEYLRDLGYEVSDSYSESNITIPDEFDAVYENYNALQTECGFDLSSFHGAKCSVYTYDIYNHPFGTCRANLIVHDGKIIGGDISSVNIAGFMTGLE